MGVVVLSLDWCCYSWVGFGEWGGCLGGGGCCLGLYCCFVCIWFDYHMVYGVVYLVCVGVLGLGLVSGVCCGCLLWLVGLVTRMCCGCLVT